MPRLDAEVEVELGKEEEGGGGGGEEGDASAGEGALAGAVEGCGEGVEGAEARQRRIFVFVCLAYCWFVVKLC